LSSVTTFIAIEHRSIEERNQGRPALRRVPVMLAAGWGGSVHVAGACVTRMSGAAPAAMAPPAQFLAEVDRSIDLSSAQSSGGFARRFMSRFRSTASFDDSLSKPQAKVAPKDELQALLSLQSADGWFDRDDWF